MLTNKVRDGDYDRRKVIYSQPIKIRPKPDCENQTGEGNRKIAFPGSAMLWTAVLWLGDWMLHRRLNIGTGLRSRIPAVRSHHNIESHQEFGGVIEALLELQRRGAVRHLGISSRLPLLAEFVDVDYAARFFALKFESQFANQPFLISGWYVEYELQEDR